MFRSPRIKPTETKYVSEEDDEAHYLSFAVKKLSTIHQVHPDQDCGFERELEAMGDIKHRNIVAVYFFDPRGPWVCNVDFPI